MTGTLSSLATDLMAREISLENQRPAQFVFSRHVQDALTNIRRANDDTKVAAAGDD